MTDETSIFSLCRRMSDESVNEAYNIIQEESRRRAHIAVMVNDINKRIADLLYELCDRDIVDVINDYTGEVLLAGYGSSHLKDREGPVIPCISVGCGRNNP